MSIPAEPNTNTDQPIDDDYTQPVERENMVDENQNDVDDDSEELSSDQELSSIEAVPAESDEA